ncbi:TPA: hypothetical protein O0001_002271 [Staphylococcus aureus]|nr:hypothetical protein [Staphylococcus aureus]
MKKSKSKLKCINLSYCYFIKLLLTFQGKEQEKLRKQKVFRIKPYFKNLISHKSIDENINNSDFVNNIIENFDMNCLDIELMAQQPKLSKENVQVVYRLDDYNIKKIENFSNEHNIKYSIVLNHLLHCYFDSDTN